ncbi:Peptidase family A1 domain [Arabidopsis thaliana x Arabidopsis arenosa]|uniref:Peptidase family A1 domain n=1 Tax=Arabidopsis thaliana x Arabidopsis arenosa TaxID=1240361 RepID=A0A8T2A812_9BRAS|nr:Peptidase family A1 domain [Arabidopsis thaliana x Arabidopsis arenosa]
MATQILLCFFLFFSSTLSSSSHPRNFSVELIHRDSPLSPLYNPKNTVTDRLNAAFLRSISRSRRLNNILSQTDLQSGLIGADGEFFMSITIGTPPVKVFAIADTGSDLTWVQCKPCQQCYKENGPIFDKKKSSTYKSEPCDSRNCHALSSSERGCDESKNVCKYRYSYGDQSFSKGDVATETISIDSASGSPVSFPGTVFGCGYNNGGTFDETGSGIIGLGGGHLSLISQLGSSISKKFSYCLSHKSATTNGTSVINLGTNSIPSSLSKDSGVISTPLVDKEPRTYYYLTLEAISVGKKKIPYTGSSYNPNDGGIFSETSGNIIIDSGTTLTLLDSGFFDKFGAAVEESVTGAKRVSDPQGLLSHCFKSGSAEIGLPEITVHFTGADVRLSPINAFVKVSEDMVCLSMIPTTEVAIYGNFAQMDFLVGYDLETRTVSFQRMDCSANL